MPQLTAIYDCATAAKEYGKAIIADGGIKYSGDIVKALAAGGHAVMLGSMLAGTDESPGEFEIYQAVVSRFIVVWGSLASMEKVQATVTFKPPTKPTNVYLKGLKVALPTRGSVADIVFQMIGGLRSGMGYCGTPNLQSLREDAQFIRMSGAGLIESHPHDVQITKESPNYSRS